MRIPTNPTSILAVALLKSLSVLAHLLEYHRYIIIRANESEEEHENGTVARARAALVRHRLQLLQQPKAVALHQAKSTAKSRRNQNDRRSDDVETTIRRNCQHRLSQNSNNES